MRLLGDKIAAGQLAEQAGIPVAPWSPGREKPITGERRVEVPIIADGQGNAWPLGVCDCACRRRGQRVLVESSSPALVCRPGARDHGRGPAAGAAGRLPQRRHGRVPVRARRCARFSFVQVNTQLGVGHPVTEAVTGLDSSSSSCSRRGWAARGRPAGAASGTRSRPICAPRTRHSGSCRRPGGSSTCDSRAGRVSGSTPVWPRATASQPSWTQ